MAKKKKDLLMCHCIKKRIIGKTKKSYGGIDCICDPYPNGTKKGKKFKEVFISSVI